MVGHVHAQEPRLGRDRVRFSHDGVRRLCEHRRHRAGRDSTISCQSFKVRASRRKEEVLKMQLKVTLRPAALLISTDAWRRSESDKNRDHIILCYVYVGHLALPVLPRLP
jgi:hypothetical protein